MDVTNKDGKSAYALALRSGCKTMLEKAVAKFRENSGDDDGRGLGLGSSGEEVEVVEDEDNDNPLSDVAEETSGDVHLDTNRIGLLPEGARMTPPGWKGRVPSMAKTKRQADEPEVLVHSTQEAVAERLLKCIEDAFTSMPDVSLNDFHDLHLLMQGPNSNNLDYQTKRRLSEFIIGYGDSHGLRMSQFSTDSGMEVDGLDTLVNACIYKNQDNSESPEIFRKLMKLIEEKPETLFLVIHDEAHW